MPKFSRCNDTIRTEKAHGMKFPKHIAGMDCFFCRQSLALKSLKSPSPASETVANIMVPVLLCNSGIGSVPQIHLKMMLVIIRSPPKIQYRCLEPLALRCFATLPLGSVLNPKP